VGEQRLWGFSSHNDLLLQKKSRVLFLREEACEGVSRQVRMSKSRYGLSADERCFRVFSGLAGMEKLCELWWFRASPLACSERRRERNTG
jgi:hypothetical protein